MKHFCTVFSLLFLSVLTAHAQQWLDKKYTYDNILNVTYGTAVNFNGRSVPLKMDIYTPTCADPQSNARSPLLMWIHGGAFLAGDKDDQSIVNLCKQFARRGRVSILSIKMKTRQNTACLMCWADWFKGGYLPKAHS